MHFIVKNQECICNFSVFFWCQKMGTVEALVSFMNWKESIIYMVTKELFPGSIQELPLTLQYIS